MTTQSLDLDALFAKLAVTPGFTVTTDGHPCQFDPDTARRNHMDEHSGRCGRCDARYCHEGCMAGEPGHVYATGKGWVTFAVARKIEAGWEAHGLTRGKDFGENHPVRRVEWSHTTSVNL